MVQICLMVNGQQSMTDLDIEHQGQRVRGHVLVAGPGGDVEGPGHVPRPRLDEDDRVQESWVPIPRHRVAPHPAQMGDLNIREYSELDHGFLEKEGLKNLSGFKSLLLLVTIE